MLCLLKKVDRSKGISIWICLQFHTICHHTLPDLLSQNPYCHCVYFCYSSSNLSSGAIFLAGPHNKHSIHSAHLVGHIKDYGGCIIVIILRGSEYKYKTQFYLFSIFTYYFFILFINFFIILICYFILLDVWLVTELCLRMPCLLVVRL